MTILKYAVLMVVALFFTLFGIQTLVTAYAVNDPFVFVLTFFASNFIILISLALMVGFTLRLIHKRKSEQTESSTPDSQP